MPSDRFPANSVLVPQWTRVEDGLPDDGASLSLVVKADDGARWVEDGFYSAKDGFTVVSYDGMDEDYPSYPVTHWSPLVGIRLPEEE